MAYFDTPEHYDAGRRFAAWFNDLDPVDRRNVETEEGPHDAFADWVNQSPGTSTEDYSRVTELYSHGLVEFGDDGQAHFRAA